MHALNSLNLWIAIFPVQSSDHHKTIESNTLCVTPILYIDSMGSHFHPESKYNASLHATHAHTAAHIQLACYWELGIRYFILKHDGIMENMPRT